MTPRILRALAPAALLALAGCTLTRADLRPEAQTLLPRFLTGGNEPAGQPIAARRCDLRLVVLTRPLKDPALNDALWGVADELAVPDDARRALEANGLRLGRIDGSMPPEVDAVLNAPPPHHVEPSLINLPHGDNTLVSLRPATAHVSLFLKTGGSTRGKDYADARGFLRLTASHDDSGGVALRVVPELQHGPIRHHYAADPSSGPFAVQQFILKDGQQEETFRELGASLPLAPGQAMVVGCRPDQPGSLGYFLLTEPEANSDRLLQKVLLVWAVRSQPGTPGAGGSLPPLAPPAGLEPIEPADAAGPARKKGEPAAAAAKP